MHCYGYGLTTVTIPFPPMVSDCRFCFCLHAANPIPFSGNRSEPVKLLTRNRAGSLRVRASVSDDVFVASRSQLSFYELLGVPESGSSVEVKHAYKQLARKYHPDVSPPGRVEEYTKRFIMVQEAYETLSDPARRAMYDRDMANGLHLAFSSRRRYNYRGVDDQLFLKLIADILRLSTLF
ncbi:DnaJ domain containing protein [Sesbania bispinosa]|nr:DnaJ domain containing protein [Sesbania bispinosa]